MKYEVGDRVKIKSLDWYNENKDSNGDVPCDCDTLFLAENKKYLGTTQTVETVYKCEGRYVGNHIYKLKGIESTDWTNEMIEGLVEEEVFIKANDVYNEEYSKGEYCHEQSFKWGFQEGYNYSHENDKLEISLKEGYVFKDENGNIINATKIVLEKKEKEYPKTYEECEKILGLEDSIIEGCLGYEYKLLNAFQKLLMCRDAYWKIAGEEMGLGKPWKPDWNDGTWKWCISYSCNCVEFDQYKSKHHTLAFPTPEMRDAFYEYFKEEIEICKELL